MGIAQTGLDGLNRAEAGVQRTATRLAQLPFSVTGEPQDVVDLSAEAVALLTNQNAFEANLKSIETAAELADSTLDLLK
jgi:hypothetical protein